MSLFLCLPSSLKHTYIHIHTHYNIRQMNKLRGEETCPQSLSRGKYLLMVIMAVDSNKEFPSPASPTLTSWKGRYSERNPVTKTIWALPADTSLSGPEFQYMKALNQMTSVVSFEICKFGWCLGCPVFTIYSGFLHKSPTVVFEMSIGCERFEKHPVCAEATASVRASGSRGNRQEERSFSKDAQGLFSPWLSLAAFLVLQLKLVKSLKMDCSKREKMISHAICNLPLLPDKPS